MRRTAELLLLVTVAVAISAPALADTVRLKNGRAYEDVIAERTSQGVRVQLSFGQLVIPADQVVAIEKSPSALAGFLARKQDLRARPDTRAADWLELARWAKVQDLASSSREAALLAAELDPRLAGLDALLRPMGLVYEDALARWIPFAESMARRGLVPWEGAWVTADEARERREELLRRAQARAQEEATRRMAEAAEAMRRTEERMAMREEARWRQERYLAGFTPVITFPGFWIPPVVVVVTPQSSSPVPPGTMPDSHDTRGPNYYSRLILRQPGSLLPPPGEPISPFQPQRQTTSGSGS